MIVGMTGSKLFTKRQKIKELIWLLKKTEEKNEIVSLGEDYGADKFVKKFASEFEIKYTEFLPYHKQWNMHCQEPAYLFGKKYSGRYYFMSYGKFVKYCDKIIFYSQIIFFWL